MRPHNAGVISICDINNAAGGDRCFMAIEILSRYRCSSTCAVNYFIIVSDLLILYCMFSIENSSLNYFYGIPPVILICFSGHGILNYNKKIEIKRNLKMYENDR